MKLPAPNHDKMQQSPNCAHIPKDLFNVVPCDRINHSNITIEIIHIDMGIEFISLSAWYLSQVSKLLYGCPLCEDIEIINKFRLGQKGKQFGDSIFKSISLYGNYCSVQSIVSQLCFSLTGNKPSSEPMLTWFAFTLPRWLTHQGRMMHICSSDIDHHWFRLWLLPVGCQTIMLTNAVFISIGPLGTKFSKVWIKIQSFSLTKRHLKRSSVKWQPSCPREDDF